MTEDKISEAGLQTREGPTMHLLVEKDRLDPHLSRIEDKLSGPGGWVQLAADDIGDWMRKAIIESYRAGVRDGFMQGAIAESKARAGE